MLLDYSTKPAPPPSRFDDEEGVRVAGLLDLAKLLKYLDNPQTASVMNDIRRGVKAAPEQFYQDEGLFLDPRNRVMKDTGPTYQGRPLPEYNTLRDLVENGSTLADYLQGTEAGSIFQKDMQNIKVGATDLPSGYAAGFTAPQGFTQNDGSYRLLQPGFLVVNRSVPANEVGSLFEHEMQHGFQNILDMPRGSNLDEMSGAMVDYLTETGNLRPAQLARIDAAAEAQKASKPYMRYAATTGEAEARAAESRYNQMLQTANLGAPQPSDYLWTHEGPQITKSMLFDIPQNASEGFSAWWQNKWKK